MPSIHKSPGFDTHHCQKLQFAAVRVNLILTCSQRALQTVQVLFIFKDLTWRLIKAVQWVKALVPKPDYLNLIFSIHIAGDDIGDAWGSGDDIHHHSMYRHSRKCNKSSRFPLYSVYMFILHICNCIHSWM